MNPVLVNEQVIPMVDPECVPEILIVFVLIDLLLTAGDPGPPRLLIAVAVVVPARLVNVMLLFETMSFTSEGVPEVDWKIIEPEAATRSTFIVLLETFTRVVTVAS